MVVITFQGANNFNFQITDGNSFKSKFRSRFSSLPGFNIIDQAQTSNLHVSVLRH